MNLFPSNLSFILNLVLLSLALSACEQKVAVPKDLAKENLIPHPVALEATGSSFELTEQTEIHFPAASTETKVIAQYLADLLRPATGFPLEVKANSSNTLLAQHINLSLLSEKDATIGEEGYVLSISEEQVDLHANKPAGLFHGIQSIRQILPASIELKTLQGGPWLLATGNIRDYPTYAHRGVMLDVARHFFKVADVKRMIDFLALYKMNVLHLHLADDQGWRLEIKSWPNLTTHGGSSEVGGGKGGFYTQAEYSELVQYAADRFITIIPEIDMPGHTNAALASYPELNCNGKAPKLYTGTKVGFSTLCTDKEITYTFVTDVVREIAALTPGNYIHIGGDESHVTAKKDYIPFIEKVQDIVHAQGKQMIGWDEIAEAQLKGNSIVQYWAEAENALAGIAQGAKVILSPASKAYLDMQYDSTTQLGLHWAGYIEVDSAYSWQPSSLVAGITPKDIWGIESPLWTETVTNMEEMEYMVFPRLPGYAEIGWSPEQGRNWTEYQLRLAQQQERLDALEINYYRSPKVPWPK